MLKEEKTLLYPQPLGNFVETEYVSKITQRALNYIKAGYAVHFRGPAGTGKTTIAKHIAAHIGRPLMMMQGDEEFTTTNLIGGEHGYSSRVVIDNFVSRVMKKEEDFTRRWVDNRLTIACKYGFTLIYDEFTRSRPEANNVLLSILEDKIINLPVARGSDDPYFKVHPDFTCIFTSNPEEYAGVFKTQDSLRDRMVTMDLDYFDNETETAITAAKSGFDTETAQMIVNIVRTLRNSGECEFSPTVRACIMIAKTLKVMEATPFSHKEDFILICQDVLASETSRLGSINQYQRKIKGLIEEIANYQLETFSSKGITDNQQSPKKKLKRRIAQIQRDLNIEH